MTGKYHIKIRNKYVTYEFEVKRKYTIIRGDSATGKTYMVRLLNSNVTEIKCEVGISVLPNSNWDILLREVHNQIFVIDEDFEAMKSNKFIDAMNRSDNYFILITRQELKGLTCNAVEEIKYINYKKIST